MTEPMLNLRLFDACPVAESLQVMRGFDHPAGLAGAAARWPTPDGALAFAPLQSHPGLWA
jgi:hypothetical protein